ncbi:MAG: GxxExxY protein [Melioribacter sp.]|uniref:GxxExxY protein n=1 Tax=Melioribacter sp. TaxID=2052167 RepID=UPI003BC02D3A
MEKIENIISYDIRGAIFNVYNNLGPGLLESVYETALAYELEKIGRKVKKQVAIPVIYNEERIDLGFRLDLLVDNLVIVEIKSVEALAPVHHKQLLTYLRLTGLKLGILVNFNSDDLEKNIVRIVNHL